MTDKVTETLITQGIRVGTEDMKKFWQERPDPDFSPAHNKAVIERSIARAEKLAEAKKKAHHENIDERVSAVSSYLRYLDKGGSSPAEEYFGKQQLAHLRGERVKAELQGYASNGKKLWRLIDTKNA